MPEDLQNGDGFGYIIAFRPLGEVNWTHAVTSVPAQSRYVYRNESILPFSPFSVKVGAYNTKGQGPFSPVTIVFSAENGETVGHVDFSLFCVTILRRIKLSKNKSWN